MLKRALDFCETICQAEAIDRATEIDKFCEELDKELAELVKAKSRSELREEEIKGIISQDPNYRVVNLYLKDVKSGRLTLTEFIETLKYWLGDTSVYAKHN